MAQPSPPSSPHAETQDSRAHTRPVRPLYLAAFVLIAIALIAAGYADFKSEERKVHANALAELTAVARLKTSELVTWRNQRRADGEILQRGHGAVLAARLLRDSSAAASNALIRRLNDYLVFGRYDAIYLLDAQGRTVLSLPAERGQASRTVQRAAAEGIAKVDVRFLDFFRDERDQKVHLAVLVPIADDARGGRLLGTLVLSIDPERYLNSQLAAWPLPSRTAEARLVRRDGSTAQFLNPLRFDRDAALTLRIPLTRQDALEVMAVTGQRGAVTGADYGGEPAIGWVAAVPDSPWLLVAHRDLSEVHEAVSARLRTVATIVSSLLLVNAALLFGARRRQQSLHVAQRLALAADLSQEMDRLQLALEGGTHGLGELDLNSGDVQLNAEFARRLGLEPVGRSHTVPVTVVLDLTHPDDRDSVVVWLEQLRLDRQQGDLELRALSRGGWIWLSVHIRVSERDEQGRPTKATGIVTDITALKGAELRSRRYSQLYAALSHSNEAIAQCGSVAELYPQICEAAVTHGGMGLAWVGLVDEATGRVQVAAAAGEVTYVDGIVVTVDPADPHGQGPTGTCIRENRPIWIDDFAVNPTTGPWHDRARPHGWTASASLPVRKRGGAVGALMFYTRAVSSFGEEDRRLLNELGANLALALDRFELREAQTAAETMLEESEARYRAMFAGSSLPMLLLDPRDARIVDANLAAAEFYGWYRETLVTMTVFDISTSTPEAIRAGLEEAFLDGRKTAQARHRLAGGDIRDVEIFSGSIQLGEQARLLSTIIDVTARVAAERSIEAAMHEKDALLREVHHRVKNNLQVITSLLRLEGGRSSDVALKRVMGDMQSRLVAMALLHEMLYRTGTFAHVDLALYLGQLSDQLRHSGAPRSGVTLVTDLAHVLVDMDTAVPCGLLVNELVSNSMKHAFPDGRPGEIRIALKPATAPGTMRLTVSDNGVGFPEGFEPQQGGTLGLKLVDSLARQLRGTLEFSRGAGATVSLTFEPRSAAAQPAGSQSR